MGALVQQHAAAFPGPGGPPGAGIIILLGPVPVGDDPVHPFDGAHFTAVQQAFHGPVDAVGPLVEHEGQGFPGLFRRADHFLRPVRLHSRRLLAQHVQPGFQRSHRQRFMLVVGRGNQHGFAAAAVNQRLPVPKHLRARQRLFRPGPAFRPRVRHRRQMNLRAFSAQDQPAVLAAHVPDADNA